MKCKMNTLVVTISHI